MSICLSHRSTAAAACGRFAAEHPISQRYRSIAGAGAQQQRRRSTGSAANAGSVMLTDLLDIFFSVTGSLLLFSGLISSTS